MNITFETHYYNIAAANILVRGQNKLAPADERERLADRLAAEVARLPGVDRVRSVNAAVEISVDRSLENHDPARLAALIAAILEVVAASGVRFAPLLLYDWLTEKYRNDHPLDGRDELLRHGPDLIRFGHLAALRAPFLAPFLAGNQPVRDLATFRAFHALPGPEQTLLRLIIREGDTSLPRPCAEGCHVPWTSPVVPSLLAADWLILRGGPWRVDRGPRLRGLDQAAGEMLAP